MRHASSAKLCWVVIAVIADGHSVGNCGHEHDTADEAEACPWMPTPWPVVCDLLVREVRRRDADDIEWPGPARAVLCKACREGLRGGTPHRGHHAGIWTKADGSSPVVCPCEACVRALDLQARREAAARRPAEQLSLGVG